jgi:ATP-dependent RNA helicase DDX55/SPB4
VTRFKRYLLSYREKAREKQRQQNLKKAKETVEQQQNVRQKKRLDQKNERKPAQQLFEDKEKKEVTRREREKAKRERELADELAMEDDYKLLKKLKKGKITEKEFTEAMTKDDELLGED